MKRVFVLDTVDKSVTPISEYTKDFTYDEIAWTPMLIRANIFQKLPACKRTFWHFKEYAGGLLPEIWEKIFGLIPDAITSYQQIINDYQKRMNNNILTPSLWWATYWDQYVKTCEERDFYFFIRPAAEKLNVQLSGCKNCDVSNNRGLYVL